ncbi:hypothetical protein [Thermococcus gorgonarius]|uniref:Uncharacterized protein n=1 Tax=Thermococcus gorgonarius TaxID=71997 RepID=A0A2Z2M3D0_THEGO|nr:hypothetical protein [Thermococcus gorgonarius]ASJ00130.1 hypothetical protein A3K92_00805 [Thermococcus gorgonarius]
MSVWAWIILIGLAVWIFDFFHNERIKHAETKTLKVAYGLGYIALGIAFLLAALLDFGLISVNSQITWLMVMLPVIALAMIALGVWHEKSQRRQ